MTGIPTTYRGIEFRSRLEAAWAVFFDLLRWDWEYEPEDRDGWIPDFALIGSAGRTLAEVKPFYTLKEAEAHYVSKIEPASLAVRGDCEEPGLAVSIDLDPDGGGMLTEPVVEYPEEVLILGVRPLFCRYGEGPVVSDGPGWLMGGLDNDCEARWVERPGGGLDFCSEAGWFGGRLHGDYDGDHYLSYGRRDIAELWAMAKNYTKYKRRKALFGGVIAPVVGR